MRTVWTYEIPVKLDTITLIMPQGAKILSVQAQGDKTVLWAEVESAALKEHRRFELVETGDPIPEATKYVGTVQLGGGTHVFHLYEVMWW